MSHATHRRRRRSRVSRSSSCWSSSRSSASWSPCCCPRCRRPAKPRARSQCQNNLKNLTLAAINFESARGYFAPAAQDRDGEPPPGVKPPLATHNGISLLLPYFEQGDKFQLIDFDWDWDDTIRSQERASTPSRTWAAFSSARRRRSCRRNRHATDYCAANRVDVCRRQEPGAAGRARSSSTARTACPKPTAPGTTCCSTTFSSLTRPAEHRSPPHARRRGDRRPVEHLDVLRVRRQAVHVRLVPAHGRPGAAVLRRARRIGRSTAASAGRAPKPG